MTLSSNDPSLATGISRQMTDEILDNPEELAELASSRQQAIRGQVRWTDYLPIKWLVMIAVGSFAASFAMSFLVAWVTK